MYEYEITVRMRSKQKINLIDTLKDLMEMNPSLTEKTKEVVYLLMTTSPEAELTRIIRREV